MKKLAIAITMRNESNVLEDCIKSCQAFDHDIVAVSMGSSDGSEAIARDYGCKIVTVPFKNDYARSKNLAIEAIDNEWLFFLEPNERITRGMDTLQLENDSVRVNIIQEKVITKQIRVIRKGSNARFSNPAFESIKSTPTHSDIYISQIGRIRQNEREEIVSKWASDKPLSSQPHYYLACMSLANGRIDEFLNRSERYLFLEKTPQMSYYMTKYYMATVLAYEKRAYDRASKLALECLMANPLMAEHWCLLGDIYYSLDKFEKAMHFYENAMILGSRRLRDDEYPFHVAKYKKHPMQMIESCKKMISTSKIYTPSK